MSGEWDEQQRKAKEILGEGCGGLDGGKCLESGTNSRGRPKRSWEKDVEDWIASVWKVGRIAEEDQRDLGTLGRRMWRTGWGQVSGEWDEQQRKAKEILGEGLDDWMGASVWRVGQTAEEGQRDFG